MPIRTLLIADDEINIRVGLKAMIEREFPERYRILLAADGREALQCCKQESPDIVITDIRMPEMDGIALIRELSGNPDVPALLILSGYDDFQFAKEAIQHQVKAYLLKPIVRDELFAALRRTEADLDRQAAVKDRLEATDRYLEGMQANALRYIWAHAELTPEEVEERCRAAGLDRFESSYYVAILDAPGHQRYWVKGKQYLQSHATGDIWLAVENRDGRLVVLTARYALLEGLAAALASESGCAGTFAAGISEPGGSLAEMKTKYEEALHALKHRLVLGRAELPLIRYEQIRSRDRNRQVPEEAVRKMANMLGTDREKEMKSMFLQLFEPERIADADIGYWEGVCRALNEQVFDQAFRTYGETSVEILKMYRSAGNLYNFLHLQDYIHAAEKLLCALNEYVRNLRTAHADRSEMNRALEYIHAHYDKPDLSMTVVSNHVSLNYSYFSERFKEYVGESFVNYLKKLRIEKAKELLVRSDDRIHEVSRRVGFDNPKQFNRVFREMEGITPMEFRQMRIFSGKVLPGGNRNVYNEG